VQRRVVGEAEITPRREPLPEAGEVRPRDPFGRGRPERLLFRVHGFHDRSVPSAYNDW